MNKLILNKNNSLYKMNLFQLAWKVIAPEVIQSDKQHSSVLGFLFIKSFFTFLMKNLTVYKANFVNAGHGMYIFR